MSDEYVYYQTPSTIISETVYHFLRGGIYGAAFGLVTPFHAPGSFGAIQGMFLATRVTRATWLPRCGFYITTHVHSFRFGCTTEAKTGIFKPAPPFSSLASVPSNAIIFGSLLAIQRFGCKTAEFARNTRDPWNDFFGCAVAYPYCQHIVVRHPVTHNRVVGGGILLAVLFANL